MTSAQVQNEKHVDVERDSKHGDDSVHVSDAPAPVALNGTEEELRKLDKQCLRRLDCSVLLIGTIFYLLNFLDRSALGNARVAGLQKELRLTTYEYLVVTTCTYVLYIFFELPSNLLLKKIGARIMLPTMVVTWGVVATCTAAVESYHGLIAIRLMLGLCEAGLFPGLVLHLSRFYRRKELQLRNALFFGAASLAGAFGGLIAAGIIKLNGKHGIAGWRWIFIVEGVITIGVGLIGFALFPSDVQSCIFLTDAQKVHWKARLAQDRVDGSNDDDDKFSIGEIIKTIKSPHVFFLFVALFCNGLTIYALAYFLPTIVAGFGYSTIHTQLLTVPPYAVAFVLSVFNALLSDRFSQRGLCYIWASFLAIVGYALYIAAEKRTNLRYGSLFLLVPGVYSGTPALISWMPSNSAPHYRRATAVALAFISTNSAGIASTWLFPARDGPVYKPAAWVSLGMTILGAVATVVNIMWLRYANNKKVQRKAAGDVGEWLVEGDRHVDFKYSY